MPQPLDVPRDPKKSVTLSAPLHCIEVQLGALVVRGRDGLPLAEGRAGETIEGGPLQVPVKLSATESPCRVRVVYDSEAVAYEAQRQRETAPLPPAIH